MVESLQIRALSSAASRKSDSGLVTDEAAIQSQASEASQATFWCFSSLAGRIMHKPKDNSRYGDEIPRPWEGKKLLFKNVFTVWLTRIVLPGKLAQPYETNLFIRNVLFTHTHIICISK